MPLFSQWSAHHRDLHSFPTRRSSDLRNRSVVWTKHEEDDDPGDGDVQPNRVRPPGDSAVPVKPLFPGEKDQDRKSTRLNSSHVKISYAVFCLKKKRTRHTVMAARD